MEDSSPLHGPFHPLAPATFPSAHDERSGSLPMQLDAESAVSLARSLKRLKPQISLGAGHAPSARVVNATPTELLLSCMGDPPMPGSYDALCNLDGLLFLFRGSVGRETGDDRAMGGLARLSNVVMHTLDHRDGSRVAVTDREVRFHWVALLDGIPHDVDSAVVDLAPGGIGVELDAAGPHPASEVIVGELQIRDERIAVTGRVRRMVRRRDRCLLGIALDAGESRDALVHAYLRERFPRLRPRATKPRAELARLFHESGYLALRAGESLSEAWHGFSQARSVDAAYTASDGRVLGHISVTQVYRHTWLLHQLATLGGHTETGASRSAVYGLVSSAPAALGGHDARALAYFSRTSRWHRRFFMDFVTWMNDPRRAVLAVWDRFEAVLDAPVPPRSPPPGFSIGPLRKPAALTATALIRAGLPPLLADCMDVSPRELEFHQLDGNSSRTRVALGLFHEGALRGVALCESAPPGASLFNVMNMAQLFLCGQSGRPPREAQRALLDSVRELYLGRGVDRPVIVGAPGAIDADIDPTLRLVETMGCVAFSPLALRAWENYCQLHMGQLYNRKRIAPNREPQGGLTHAPSID